MNKTALTSPEPGRRKQIPVPVWFAVLLGVVFLVCLIGWSMLEPNRSIADRLVRSAAVAGGLVLALSGLTLFGRWVRHWRNFRRFLFGAACVATLLALAVAIENWRGKRAWDRHRARLETAGEQLSIAAFIPPPVPDDQNFALTPLLAASMNFTRDTKRLVWHDTNGLARLEKATANARAYGQTNDLGPGNIEKGTLADLNEWKEFYLGNTNYVQPGPQLSPAEAVLAALSGLDPEVRELRQAAATRPLARFPIRYNDEPSWSILLPHLARVKQLTVLFHVRAVAELELRQSAPALEDLQVGFRLSDSLKDEPILIDHLVRAATLAVNLQTIREGLHRHAWTDAQLAELAQRLEKLDFLAEYNRAMRGERALNLDGLQFLRRHRIRDPGEYVDAGSDFPWPAVCGFPGGWYYQNMVTTSQAYEDFILPAADERAKRVFPEIAERAAIAVHQMRTGPYTVFTKLLLPALDKSLRKTARMQFLVDATRIGCALERYRLAEGRLPETLSNLVPRFLAAIPADVMDGQPLRFKATDEAGYVIWSVGWNKTDEGGRILAATPGSSDIDQIQRGPLRGLEVDQSAGDWLWGPNPYPR